MIRDEFKLIEKIKRLLPRPRKDILESIGDDAAVTRFGNTKCVSTVDTLVEKTHFDLSYTDAQSLGHKALAVSLSDLAAMGATPKYGLLSWVIRPGIDESFVMSFYKGYLALARRYEVQLIGGNISTSKGPLVVDSILLGECKGRYLSRKNANVGDLLVLVGHVGTSSAGYFALKKLGKKAIRKFPSCTHAHLRPEPQVKIGQGLSRFRGVTAMIDISDGLLSEITHLAKASKAGVLLRENDIPQHQELKEVAKFCKKDLWELMLHGGEEYTLLLSCQKSAFPSIEKYLRTQNSKGFVIGEIKDKSLGKFRLNSSGKKIIIKPLGWNHFQDTVL